MAADRTKLPMDLNIPLTYRIKWVTVWPNDRTKNGGEGYGPSVSIAGSALIGGEWVHASTFLKGAVWAALKALHLAGVLPQHDKNWEDPEERTNLPVNEGAGAVTLTYAKHHGDPYAHLDVVAAEGDTPPAPKPAPPKAPPAKPTPLPTPAEAPDPDAADLIQQERAQKRATIAEQYRALFEENARYLDKLGKELEIPVDASAINAMTFSIFATQRDRGLV